MIIGTATRQGTINSGNADAARTFTTANLTTAAALIDGIGHEGEVHTLAPVLAEVAARVAAQRGPLAGLLSASQLMADRGPDIDGPDAVAVVARCRAGADSVVDWVGDARAYGWDGYCLQRYTTDHTVGEQLRVNGAPWELAADHDNWIRTSLGLAVVATVYEVEIPANELVILTTDGVHDQVPAERLVELVQAHEGDPHALADALVAAAQPDESGYRDDATAIVLRP